MKDYPHYIEYIRINCLDKRKTNERPWLGFKFVVNNFWFTLKYFGNDNEQNLPNKNFLKIFNSFHMKNKKYLKKLYDSSKDGLSSELYSFEKI